MTAVSAAFLVGVKARCDPPSRFVGPPAAPCGSIGRGPPRRGSNVDFQLSLQTESARSAYPEAPLAVEIDTPIAEVIGLMQAQKAGAAIVCQSDQLVGVFTERDALRLMADGADLSPPVSSVMSSEPTTVDESATVGEAIGHMSDGGYRHLPMVSASDPGEPVGMIDVRGLVRYLVEHFPNTIYNLPPSSDRPHAEREGA